MKIKKYQKPAGVLPKKSFWWNLANQLQSAPSNGETTIAAHSADLNRQVEQARKEAKGKGQNPDRAEEEVYRRGLRTNGAIVGGAALGALFTTVPAIAETVKFATKTPVGKKALQKVMKDTAISMAGGTAVDALSNKMTGMSFGKWAVGSIPGARNLYDRSGLARFGIDMLNPGYLGLSGNKALIEGTQKSITNLAHKVDNAATIANARLTGKLKFGNPTTYTGIHQSNTPITKVQFPFNRWDVTTHGADPNGFWLTLAETPNTEGTMASRPFASRWTATAQKPLIQIGEIENFFKGKNNLRNTIVNYGKRRGADAFEFRGIKDNALPTTDVVMVTDRTNPTLIEQLKNPSFKRKTTDEFAFRMFENGHNNTFSEYDVENYINAKQKGNYLDRTYDGRYTVNPKESFNRRNAGGEVRKQYMLKHPVKSLDTPTNPAPTIEEELANAGRDFAIKYQSDFEKNFPKAIKYDSLSGGTLGLSEGTILGRMGWSGKIKVSHSPGDASVLSRIVENHEAGHATGNMNENYLYNLLIENGLIDKEKAGKYLLDADRGEISAHLSELPDYLGFTGYSNGHYTGHPFGKQTITSTDVNNYNAWMHKNGFSKTIWDSIQPGKLKEFVKFLNEHPFAVTLPVAGISSAAVMQQNKKPNSK